MAGSPQSTLCGLPASGEDSPNGVASQVSSAPSSPLEQPSADPWDLLSEAAGQMARLRTDSIPVPAKNATAHPGRAAAPLARMLSPPSPDPKAAAGNYYPRSQLQQQIQAARVSSSAIDCGVSALLSADWFLMSCFVGYSFMP